MHSSRSIAGRPASDRQGETVMIAAPLLPSIWLRRTANVSPCVEVIPAERIMQNRGGPRDDEKLSRGESKIKPAPRADVTPARSCEASRCSSLAVTPPTNASSRFKHLSFKRATRGDVRAGSGLWKNQSPGIRTIPWKILSQGATYLSDLLCSQETTHAQTINPNSLLHSAASIFSEHRSENDTNQALQPAHHIRNLYFGTPATGRLAMR